MFRSFDGTRLTTRVVDLDRPRDLLEPGEAAEARRLAAARRADEHEELAVLDQRSRSLTATCRRRTPS
jgi:hypothetical protein